MAIFEKYDPKNEKELHSIIASDLDSLEAGIQLLKQEPSIGSGIPDFLWVDSGGRIIVVEVKLGEDENILFQSLRYFADVNKNRYALAKTFSDHRIDPGQPPRIILIAKRFSEDLRLLSTLVTPSVELYEYKVLHDSTGQKGIVYNQASLPRLEDVIVEPLNAEAHKTYITNESLRGLFEKKRSLLRDIDDQVEEYITQSYVGYKYKGRQIAWISTRRKSFDFGTHIISDNGGGLSYDSVRIENGDEDCSELIEKVKNTLLVLKEKDSG